MLPPEPIFTDIYGPKEAAGGRERRSGNPKLRAATNTSDNVEANITNFHLEGNPPDACWIFCEKYGISMTCLLLNGPSDPSPEGE